MLNYNKLKYFTVVARHLNISRAAAELFIGQPALSTHIKELEDSLGVILLDRSNRRLALTEAGKLLYDRVHEFYEGEETLLRDVRNAGISNRTSLKIASVGAEVIRRLPGIIKEFQQEYPAAHVELHRMNIEPMNEGLRHGIVDIGLQITSSRFILLDDPEFNLHPLRKSRIQVAVADTHPLADQSMVTVNDLRHYPIVMQNRLDVPEHTEFIWEHCRKAGFTPNISADFTFIEPMLTAVSTGEAITFTSEFAPLQGYDNIRLLDFELDIPVELCLIWKKDNADPVIGLFLRHIVDYFSIYGV